MLHPILDSRLTFNEYMKRVFRKVDRGNLLHSYFSLFCQGQSHKLFMSHLFVSIVTEVTQYMTKFIKISSI